MKLRRESFHKSARVRGLGDGEKEFARKEKWIIADEIYLQRHRWLRLDLLAGPFGAAATAVAQSYSPAQSSNATQSREKHHEPLLPFKYDIETSVGWTGEGGSAKEANVSEFPISKSIAGVSMRLKPGGLRELHWHAIAAEWAYMIEGNVRATVISPNGQAESSDFGPGDVWYFPKGHGHALQSLGPGDAHFILVFDDGNFSEFGTFSITDWVSLTPPSSCSAKSWIAGSDGERDAARRTLYRAGKSAARDSGSDAQRRAGHKSISAQIQVARAPRKYFSGRRGKNRVVRGISDSNHDDGRADGFETRARCAKCTGIRMRTSGSTTSRAARGWEFSARTGAN